MIVNILLSSSHPHQTRLSAVPTKLDETSYGKSSGNSAYLGGNSSNTPSANTIVISHGETKASQQIKTTDVTDCLDNYLGSNQTNIKSRNG